MFLLLSPLLSYTLALNVRCILIKKLPAIIISLEILINAQQNIVTIVQIPHACFADHCIK